ncbi:MAG: PEGA domain-containing protein [Candidatus Staskawiczbacteria bacterium]|nr:PEGA domain-containing protein [Candidatus Staskawiczbacteria bacterium]
MTKKVRLIILLSCAIFFFIAAPAVVVYSLGYRIDFEQKKISATGGVFIKAWPESAEVFVDSEFVGRTKMFAGSIFAQNLLPKQHNVLVKKEGYFPYQKTLDIKEKEVVKLEHILLFKENILFDELESGKPWPGKKQEPNELFFIKNGALYQNNPDSGPLLILKNSAAFELAGNNKITWLGLDGFLYDFDISSGDNQKLSSIPLKINKKNNYKLNSVFQNIFLFENDNLLLFDQKIKEFLNFYGPVKEIELSPDQKKLLFYNDYEILFSYVWQLSDQSDYEKIFLNRFSEKISQCQWLNNDYIVFTVEGRIKISETDNKNNINIVTLPENLALLNGTSARLFNPGNGKEAEIYFSQQDKKLYILDGDKTFLSEKILP